MIKAVRALVRYKIPQQPNIPLGAVVDVSDRAINSPPGRMFPAIRSPGPGGLFWLPCNYLLPYTEYLHRQPLDEFWMLLSKHRLRRGEPRLFLANPYAGLTGPVGFRFESPGEVAHYLDFFGLDRRMFKLVHVTDYPKDNE